MAEALGYRNAPDASRHLDADEKGTQILRTPGGDQKLTTINESGLYALALRSRKSSRRQPGSKSSGRPAWTACAGTTYDISRPVGMSRPARHCRSCSGSVGGRR